MLTTVGGHWLALQSYAWARMILDRSQQMPLKMAIWSTFDGQHPCALCFIIQQGRQQEQSESNKLPWAMPDKMPELLCEERGTPVPPPPTEATRAVPFVPRLHADFIESPPAPPPKAA